MLCAGMRCYAAPIRQVRAAGCLEELSDAGSSRTPFCLASRTRTIWQYWSVPSLSGLLSTLIPCSRGSGCPQLHVPAATSTKRWPPTTARLENASWRSMSANHSRSGPSASNWRSTRSAGRAASSSGMVVRLVSPLTTPFLGLLGASAAPHRSEPPQPLHAAAGATPYGLRTPRSSTPKHGVYGGATPRHVDIGPISARVPVPDVYASSKQALRK